MGPDGQDHRAIHPLQLGAEHLRPAECAPRGLEPVDRRALLPEEDDELRELRPGDLQVQRALVRLEPELLPELVLVSLLAHVERALTETARGAASDRDAIPKFEDPEVVRVLPLERLETLRSDFHPLLPARKVPLDQTVFQEFQDPLRGALLAHRQGLPELPGGERDEVLQPTPERDMLQGVRVVRLHRRSDASRSAKTFSEAFNDEMGSGAEEDAGDPRVLQTPEERCVVRDDS